MESPQGALLQRTVELDSLLQLPGMALSMRDIDMEEWNALQVLWSERERHREKQQRSRRWD